jgi:hypothetical protein
MGPITKTQSTTLASVCSKGGRHARSLWKPAGQLSTQPVGLLRSAVPRPHGGIYSSNNA